MGPGTTKSFKFRMHRASYVCSVCWMGCEVPRGASDAEARNMRKVS